MPDTPPIADRIVQAAADPLGPAAFVALGTVEGARHLARQVATAALRELGDSMDYDPNVSVMGYGDLHALANQIEQGEQHE